MAFSFPSFQFSRVRSGSSGSIDTSQNPSTSGVVTKQPQARPEIRLQIGGESDLASQVSQIAGIVSSIIEHPRTQKGCVVCYEQCSNPCERRFGSCGRWFCTCFQACCIVETTSTSNIPQFIDGMNQSYGPISLGLALSRLEWNVLSMVQSGANFTEEQKQELEAACQEAKNQCSGGMREISQSFFYDASLSITSDDDEVQQTLPILLGIIGSQAWLNPEQTPTPPPCWLIDNSDNMIFNATNPNPGRRDSIVCSGIQSSASASKYKQSATQKFLSRLIVKSLTTGQVGILGFEKAHLVTWIFEKFLCISAGPNSPLIKSGACPSYEIKSFIRLLMLILLCCGYVPVDSSEQSPVDISQADDPFMKIFLRSQRVYLAKSQTSKAPTKRQLTRQVSISSEDSTSNAPADDYHLPDGVECPPDDENDEIIRQKELLSSSSNLTELFSVMKIAQAKTQ